MELPDKVPAYCLTCMRELDDETAATTQRTVIVGLQDDGPGRPPKWIVRPYCPTCAENHYHATVYGDGFHV